MRKLIKGSLLIASTAFLAVPALAQDRGEMPLVGGTLDAPAGEFFVYTADSGYHDNVGVDPETVWVDFVEFENSAWLRLYYGSVELDGDSFVRVTSMLDGEIQELDRNGLAMWSDSSAYFNGESVLLELVAAPNTIGNRIVVSHVATEFVHNDIEGFCGICGVDERAPTNEPYAGRILPTGCTATIWNENSCLVSAGHCFGGGMVIEFNVPLSNSNCSLNHPPIEDQFPITGSSTRNSGVGADWMVNTTGTNNLGETAFEHMGALRRIKQTPASNTDPATVWGYAVDNDCTLTQTQQISPNGIITRVASSWYETNADITFGNSGSSLIVDDEIVGIVTHCSYGCPNFATRIDNADFASARTDLCVGDLIITGPVPKIAGQVNTLTIENATPFADITIAYSLSTGSSDIPNCNEDLLINNAIIAGVVTADANGDASFSAFVANAASGRNILIQAYEEAGCRITDLLVADFP